MWMPLAGGFWNEARDEWNGCGRWCGFDCDVGLMHAVIHHDYLHYVELKRINHQVEDLDRGPQPLDGPACCCTPFPTCCNLIRIRKVPEQRRPLGL